MSLLTRLGLHRPTSINELVLLKGPLLSQSLIQEVHINHRPTILNHKKKKKKKKCIPTRFFLGGGWSLNFRGCQFMLFDTQCNMWMDSDGEKKNRS